MADDDVGPAARREEARPPLERADGRLFRYGDRGRLTPVMPAAHPAEERVVSGSRSDADAGAGGSASFPDVAARPEDYFTRSSVLKLLDSLQARLDETEDANRRLRGDLARARSRSSVSEGWTNGEGSAILKRESGPESGEDEVANASENENEDDASPNMSRKKKHGKNGTKVERRRAVVQNYIARMEREGTEGGTRRGCTRSWRSSETGGPGGSVR